MPEPVAPICVEDHIQMRCEKTGVIVLRAIKSEAPLASIYAPGLDLGVAPFEIRRADLYKCPQCEWLQVKGFSQEGVFETDPRFAQEIENWNQQPDEFKIWYT